MKPGFLWGAATSAHQIEGENVHSDWWAFEQDGRVEGGARSGLATNHRKLFAHDLQLASNLGLNAYRFSIEWVRIEPKEGQWDESALEWYVELVRECRRQGLEPMATLHHFTLPKWFADRGGFAQADAPQFFLRYVERVLSRLADHVTFWCTFNEPMVLAIGSYLGRFMPPAVLS